MPKVCHASRRGRDGFYDDGHVERLQDEPSLTGYHLLPSVRADLLAKLGRTEEAKAEWRRAAELTRMMELVVAEGSGRRAAHARPTARALLTP